MIYELVWLPPVCFIIRVLKFYLSYLFGFAFCHGCTGLINLRAEAEPCAGAVIQFDGLVSNAIYISGLPYRKAQYGDIYFLVIGLSHIFNTFTWAYGVIIWKKFLVGNAFAS